MSEKRKARRGAGSIRREEWLVELMLNIRWTWERRAEADVRQHAVVEGCSVGKTCIGVVDGQTEADSSDGDGREV